MAFVVIHIRINHSNNNTESLGDVVGPFDTEEDAESWRASHPDEPVVHDCGTTSYAYELDEPTEAGPAEAASP